jgi:hypothetical protein
MVPFLFLGAFEKKLFPPNHYDFGLYMTDNQVIA